MKLSPVEICPGVLMLEDLMSEQQAFRFSISAVLNGEKAKPNSMNKYGLLLGGRLRPLLAKMQAQIVEPLWLSRFGGRPLKKHPYAFVVDYDMQHQRSLGKHFDSGDVTLNVCLGHAFAGGDLIFYEGRKQHRVKHKIGRAFLHKASVYHRATPLTDGARSNLIFWCEERKTR